MVEEKGKEKSSAMPEVIICGFEGGGTTLIEEILLNTGEFEGYFECGFLLVAEPKNFLDYNPYFSMTQEAWNLTREQMEIICDSDNFNEMYSKLRDYSKIKKKLFDKTPKYMKNLTDVIQKSPNSKVIVIVRDPRAVIYSWVKRGLLVNKENIEKVVNRYRRYIRGFELAYKKYPEKIHYVQYEKLCINPRDEIEKICKFLDIEYKKEISILRSVKNKKNVKGEAVSSEMIYEYKNNLDPRLQKEVVTLLPKNFKYFFNRKLNLNEDFSEKNETQKKITINRKIKLAHHLINDKLLVSVSPRAGHMTFLALAELLQKNSVKYERINFNEDVKKIVSLKNVKKVKFVRNPFNRAVSSYTIFCDNLVFELWRHFGLNLEQRDNLTFRQFIQLLKTKNIQNINHHLANQVENGEGKLFDYDKIEKVENYLEVIPQLLKEAEVDIDLKSLEPKHIRKKIDSKEPAMDIPFKDFLNKDENKGKKGLQQPPYECFYDEELKKEVAEIYKTDLYDYDIEPIVEKIEGEKKQIFKKNTFLDRIKRDIISINSTSNIKSNKKKELYVFLHIPKNGGTSLRESLGSLFNNNNKIYWYHDLRVGPIPKEMSSFEEFNKGLDLYKYISKLSSPEKDNINFISSHTLNLKKLQQYFPTREFKVMFILREPASRIVSLYNHARFIKLRKNNIILETNDKFFLLWCKSNSSRVDFFQARILYNFFSIKEGDEEELHKQIDKCFVVGDFNNYEEFIKEVSEKIGSKISLKRLNYAINNYKQYSSKEKIFILNDLVNEKLYENIPALRKESELIKKTLSKNHSKYKPLMTSEAIEFMDNFLKSKKDARVLEFGSGYSTVWLSERTKNLVSIEHNKEWYDKIKNILKSKNKKVDYRLLNRPYFDVCEKFKDEYFDLIIVDGRDRVECLKKALPKLKKEGYILLDDAQREKYNEAKELLKNWDCEKTFSPKRDTYYWKKPIKEIKNKKKPFDPAIYIASNAKLIETIGYDLQKAKKHYLKEGKSNKLPIDLFNPEEYLKKYPDLSRAFGRNLERTTRHYIVNGYKESRFWTSDIAKIDFVLKQEPHHKGALREKSLITEKILNNFDSKSSLTKSEEDIIGIGIVTYNRLDFLKGCVNNIRKNTKSPYFLVIADDGSTDGTKEWCFSEGLLVISGENRGVCWNKNRALYYLKEYTNANCILLLEDDCWPEKPGWELDWLSATRKFSHINYAAPWILTNHEKPFPIKNNQETSHIYLLNRVTGQCTACSRKALECVGYLDSRFKGYGHGHVEWTKRFMKGRKIKNPSININKGLYPAIKGGLSVQKTKSNINTKDLERNANIFRSLVNEPIYRNPWVNDKEKFIFLEEINIASEIFKKNSKNKPLMTHEAIEFMNNFLKSRKNANILEFGSGYSTVWLSERTKNLVSIEHNKEWYDKIQDILKSKNKKVDYRFLNRPYSNVCDKFRDEYFDLIIVDGRDRVECLKKALPKLKKEGYILLDDAQREKYNEAKELLKNWDCEKTFSPQRDTYYWKKPIKEIKKNIEDKSVLVAIAKNEAPYLLEWIIYHKFIIGFDEIIIYDNDSTDKTEYLLKKLQEKGLCKYIKWPRVNGKKPQHSAYDHAVYANKLDFEWIMFLDIDEFLVLKKFENIHEVIYDFKDKADCICFNWLCFGPTDQKEYNSELVIKRFTHSNKNNSPVNSHMKSIMKIDSIREINIHIPFLKNNTKYFHICGNELIFGKNPQVEHITSKKFINQDVAQINHYQRKSEEENKFRTIQGRATVLENHSNVNMKPRKINVDLEFKFKNKDILKHVKKLEEIMEPIKKELNYSELERDFKEFIKNEVKRYNEIITKEKKNPRETPKFFIYKNKILEEINSPNLQNKISTHLTRYYMYNSIYQVLLKQKDLSGSILGISGLGAISNMFPKENKRTNISYPEYDVTNLKQIKDDSYDIVICDQVLEHVTEPFKAVSEMRRVLKKGGLLILTTCLMNQIHAHPIDFWRFTPEALRYLCKDFSHIIDATGWGNAEAMRLILAGKRGEKIIPGTELEKVALKSDGRNLITTWIVARK